MRHNMAQSYTLVSTDALNKLQAQIAGLEGASQRLSDSYRVEQSQRANEIAALRRELEDAKAENERLKGETAPTFEGGSACYWHACYQREMARVVELLDERGGAQRDLAALRLRLDTANKLVDLHTMSGDQLAEAQREVARLKVLCDEGAAKIAELRQERDAARGFSLGTSAAVDELQRNLSYAIEDRDASAKARDYWHKEFDDLNGLVIGAMDRISEWRKGLRK